MQTVFLEDKQVFTILYSASSLDRELIVVTVLETISSSVLVEIPGERFMLTATDNEQVNTWKDQTQLYILWEKPWQVVDFTNNESESMSNNSGSL